MTRIWEMKPTDVMRFVLSREDWDTLIKALAGAAAWAPSHAREIQWKALDVLKSAETDVDASKMIKALTEIVDYTKKHPNDRETIINMMASNGLQPADQKEQPND